MTEAPLAAQLAGRTMKEEEVREFVVTKTPFYLYKSAVNLLRADGRATPAKKANWPVKFAGASAINCCYPALISF